MGAKISARRAEICQHILGADDGEALALQIVHHDLHQRVITLACRLDDLGQQFGAMPIGLQIREIRTADGADEDEVGDLRFLQKLDGAANRRQVDPGVRDPGPDRVRIGFAVKGNDKEIPSRRLTCLDDGAGQFPPPGNDAQFRRHGPISADRGRAMNLPG